MKKERKSLKEVVKDNKHVIIYGTTLAITTGAFIYVLKLYINGQSDIKELLLELSNAQKEYDRLTKNMHKETTDNMQTLYEAASEGMIQEAIATTIRKLNKREMIRDRLIEHLKKAKDKEIQNKLTRTMEEIAVLSRRYNKFEEARKAYEILDEVFDE